MVNYSPLLEFALGGAITFCRQFQRTPRVNLCQSCLVKTCWHPPCILYRLHQELKMIGSTLRKYNLRGDKWKQDVGNFDTNKYLSDALKNSWKTIRTGADLHIMVSNNSVECCSKACYRIGKKQKSWRSQINIKLTRSNDDDSWKHPLIYFCLKLHFWWEINK